jgi:hypothetical protein
LNAARAKAEPRPYPATIQIDRQDMVVDNLSQANYPVLAILYQRKYEETHENIQ